MLRADGRTPLEEIKDDFKPEFGVTLLSRLLPVETTSTLVDRKRYILLTLFYYLTIKQTLSLLWTERLEDILAPRNNATAKKCAEVRFGTPHHQNSHKM